MLILMSGATGYIGVWKGARELESIVGSTELWKEGAVFVDGR